MPMPPPPPPREDFSVFPFAPYSIQSEFMSFLYAALSSGPGALALLESPTGQSPSTISSSLPAVVMTYWPCALFDAHLKLRQDAQHHLQCAAVAPRSPRRCRHGTGPPSGAGGPRAGGDDDEPDWLRDFTPLPLVKDSTKKKAKPPASRKTVVSRKPDGFGEEDGGDDEGEFLLVEYESDSKDVARRGVGKRAHCGDSSSSKGGDLDEEEDEEEVTPKVYFTSRTHSRLSSSESSRGRSSWGRIRTVCLGSRKNLCINKDVLKMGSANRINERCLELQRKKKSTKVKLEDDQRKVRPAKRSRGCPMLRSRSLQKELRSEVSNQGALDIEDLT